MPGLCTLTVLHWEGEPLMLGHYLKAPRGRTAFLIVDIKRARPGLSYVAKVRCERHDPNTLGPDAIIHAWYWSKR